MNARISNLAYPTLGLRPITHLVNDDSLYRYVNTTHWPSFHQATINDDALICCCAKYR